MERGWTSYVGYLQNTVEELNSQQPSEQIQIAEDLNQEPEG